MNLSGFAPHHLSGEVGGVEGEGGRLARMFWRGSPRMILTGNRILPAQAAGQGAERSVVEGSPFSLHR